MAVQSNLVRVNHIVVIPLRQFLITHLIKVNVKVRVKVVFLPSSFFLLSSQFFLLPSYFRSLPSSIKSNLPLSALVRSLASNDTILL